MARKLRIALSVFFGVLTIALCVLWVRSYCLNEIVTQVSSRGFRTTLGTKFGWVYVYRGKSISHASAEHGWRYNSHDPRSFGDTGWTTSNDAKVFWIPYVLIVGLTAMATHVAWIRPRFCLRTQFVVTTLVAVVLQIEVWLTS